jgi:ribosomal protein S18 acetylase RimI-like enzyme
VSDHGLAARLHVDIFDGDLLLAFAAVLVQGVNLAGINRHQLRPGSIEFARVPSGLARKLGRYEVPIFRLTRLAVSRSLQGRGLGGELLLAAGTRSLAVAAEVGGVALAIDAKNTQAARWYERYGAVRLLDDQLKLILPLTVIAEAITAAQKKIR